MDKFVANFGKHFQHENAFVKIEFLHMSIFDWCCGCFQWNCNDDWIIGNGNEIEND